MFQWSKCRDGTVHVQDDVNSLKGTFSLDAAYKGYTWGYTFCGEYHKYFHRV